MAVKKRIRNYKIITEEYLNRYVKSGVYTIKNASYFMMKDYFKYYVDGKKIMIDYTMHELEIGIWLVHSFGGNLYMQPKINIPEGIKTPDYLWNGERWDLKEIKSSGKRVIDNRINGTKKQATNYIFDITKSSLTNKEVLSQICKIYDSFDRNWVDKIIVYRNGNLIAVFKRK